MFTCCVPLVLLCSFTTQLLTTTPYTRGFLTGGKTTHFILDAGPLSVPFVLCLLNNGPDQPAFFVPPQLVVGDQCFVTH